ncbi:hypothetical protein O0I10_011452 [Lichtheimia ornata]|uniref:Heterokaryon incompatibility domain-containing protein n=1 Tax=Lichtheimia ornata TaxID=688661 RepID=A0AAD7UTM5_9FUNG|nr:uncharacterized protein O0I10_011452 [Lichtheimia ornata]KAJ8652918.1 hypothetical protein O0I10_011452 [Lichtheimia ornata]
MTCDTDENNDDYQINIQHLEHDRDNKYKEFFEKGLGALFDDEHFLLLYVPDNGDKMQIVQPASNLFHRRRMIKRINEAKHIPSFYYALSHLWGLTENDRYHWNDIHEYVNDEQGQPVKPVSMRPEKRDTLLAMLRDHPDSYWWIDVLCARTDTPLDIMGDIYSCCLECIAMIDCEPNVISEIRTISGTAEEALEELYDSREGGYLKYKDVKQTQAPQLFGYLYIFMQSQWWKRVWTWQEMALPVGDVRFMAETATHQSQNSTVTLNQLLGIPYIRMAYLLKEEVPLTPVHESEMKIMRKVVSAVKEYLSGIEDARRAGKGRFRSNWGSFYHMIYSLSDSTRRCYDPCDYVYGVLGMLQIKIPRMEDPNEVWRCLLNELDRHPVDITFAPVKCIDRADEIDLLKVRAIGEVYRKLNDIYYGAK